jgi:hypothetical protein
MNSYFTFPPGNAVIPEQQEQDIKYCTRWRSTQTIYKDVTISQ